MKARNPHALAARVVNPPTYRGCAPRQEEAAASAARIMVIMGWDATTRTRGRKGVEQRTRRLRAEPLCRHCYAKGITTLAREVDHITPLSAGGTDTDDNVQSLCLNCHAAKTAKEQNIFAASNHPDWLERSAIPLTIVCGPPASGKATFVSQRAKMHDHIICLDTIMQDLSPRYQHWAKALDKHLLNAAVRERNARLGALKQAATGQAWFIISAPTQAERDWWQGKLGGEVVLLHPGVEECRRRAMARGTPRAVDGINLWEAKSRAAWSPRITKAKPTFGADGWPV